MRVDYYRQRLVMDLDERGRISRLSERFGHYDRYGIPDVTHAVFGEYGPRRVAARRIVKVLNRNQAWNVAEPIRGHIDARQYCEHPGRLRRFGGMYTHDLGVGMRRTDDVGVRRTWKRYIV
jgi:hypothetical protein